MPEHNVVELVRICPLCGKHNPPEETFCACGAMLADVDFTHLGVKPAQPAAEQAAQPLAALLQPAPETLICPHADCAQPNPAGSVRCVYCNRPLVAARDESLDERQAYLPATLRTQFHVLEVMPAGGGQADLLLAETPQGEPRVVKIYRNGIRPDWEVLKNLQSVPAAHLVKFFGYGETNGVSWEAMEYCAEGSLRGLLERGPQSSEMIRRLVGQMAPLLTALHARHILHRDIKPENILLRSSSPLEIALSDFGAASLKMATQYFTGGARTAHYAAPEVLTGVLDEKADWWSLGMVVLEAATGKHPFAGLSEQIALHQLATRVVEVKDVYDDSLKMLCRGLLLRNPKQRWGADEVARWLAGDPALAMPEERGEGTLVRPYTLVQAECTDRNSLALALAKNWGEGKKDLARGVVANWVENELRDFNLARDISDVMIRRDLSDDARLLRVIMAALPGMPPVWKGRIITQATLARAAVLTLREDREALDWILSLYMEDVFKTLGDRGNADMSAIAAEWQRAVESYKRLWERAKQLEEAWRKDPASHVSRVADVDYLMFIAPHRMNLPSLTRILPEVVLALYVPAYVKSARVSVERAAARMGENSAWFGKFLEEARQQGDLAWAIAQRLAPFAQEDAARETAAQTQTVGIGNDLARDALQTIEKQCDAILGLTGMNEMNEDELLTVRAAVNGWLETAAWAKKLEHNNAALDQMTAKMEPVNESALRLLPALDEHQHNLEVREIWMRPSRFFTILLIIMLVGRYSAHIGVPLAAAGVIWVIMLARKARASREPLADMLEEFVSSARSYSLKLREARKAE